MNLSMTAILKNGETASALYCDSLPSEDFQDFVEYLAREGYWPDAIKCILVFPE